MMLKAEPANANKRFTTSEKPETKSNHFVQHTPLSKDIQDFGFEYYLDVTNDNEYINKIYEKNLYNQTESSEQEFYSTLFSIMNTNEERNAGKKPTKGEFNPIKCFPLCSFAIRKICGKCLNNEPKEEVKNEKTTQEDLYILKLRSLVELGRIKKKDYQYNLNSLRFVVERIIQEFSPALNISVFQKQNAVTDLLAQLRRFTMDKFIHKTILLSYKLFKTFQDRNEMRYVENRQEAAKKIHEVLLPYIRLLEMDQNLISQTKANPNMLAYYKIKGMLSQSEVIAIMEEFPSQKSSSAVQEQFRNFLREEINLKEHLRKTASRNNPVMTEQIELKVSESVSPKESMAAMTSGSPIKTLKKSPTKPIKENYIRDSSPSIREIQYEDLVEGVNAFPTDIYTIGLDRKGSQQNLQNQESESVTDFTTAAAQAMGQKVSSPDTLEGGQETRKKQRKVTGSPKKFFQGILGSKNASPERGQKLENDDQFPKEKQPEKELFNLIPCNEDNSPNQANNEQANVSGSPMFKPKEEIALEVPGMMDNFPDDDSNGETPFETVLRLGYDEKSQWEKVCNNPTIKIEKIRPEGSPVLLIRAWAFVQGFSPKEIFDQIFDTENRAKWDTVTVGLRVVENISDTCHVIYFYVKTPIGISERDFVQIRNFKMDYPETGTIVMTFKSQVHPNAPPIKNRVRADTHIAGYILKPSTRAPNSTDICILSQVDIKGNIPKIIVNMASGKAPAEWVNKLVKACERTRKEKTAQI